jgi:hypothetical protein
MAAVGMMVLVVMMLLFELFLGQPEYAEFKVGAAWTTKVMLYKRVSS